MIMRDRRTTVLFTIILLFSNNRQALSQDETPKDIIATQIRKQGFPCDAPLSSTRDPEDSRADSPVWILDCKNQKYKVRLTPGMAASVEKIN